VEVKEEVKIEANNSPAKGQGEENMKSEKLTPKQIELGSKYLATINVGTMDGKYGSESDLLDSYRTASQNHYSAGIEEGIDPEVKGFAKSLKKADNKHYVGVLRRELPWMFAVNSPAKGQGGSTMKKEVAKKEVKEVKEVAPKEVAPKEVAPKEVAPKVEVELDQAGFRVGSHVSRVFALLLTGKEVSRKDLVAAHPAAMKFVKEYGLKLGVHSTAREAVITHDEEKDTFKMESFKDKSGALMALASPAKSKSKSKKAA
jgi:hypothetical protein